MPGFDRRGPYGAGPMTGGGRGLCNYATQRNRSSSRFGRAMGGGFGRGIRGSRWPRGGFGWGMPAGYGGFPEDAAGELESLKAQANALQSSLEAINKRMAELEKSSE